MRLCLIMFIFIDVMLCMLTDDISDADNYDVNLIIMKLMRLMFMMLKI